MIAPGQIEGKAELFVEFEDRLTVFDAMILCRFYRDLYLWDTLGEIVHALTGLPSDTASLRKYAANISTLVRKFNLREGLKAEDDWLSQGLFKQLKKTGHEIKESELAYMLKEYYTLRGWSETGVPK
jgi:aldehyde:ferredoxin oxidoreductase